MQRGPALVEPARDGRLIGEHQAVEFVGGGPSDGGRSARWASAM